MKSFLVKHYGDLYIGAGFLFASGVQVVYGGMPPLAFVGFIVWWPIMLPYLLYKLYIH